MFNNFIFKILLSTSDNFCTWFDNETYNNCLKIMHLIGSSDLHTEYIEETSLMPRDFERVCDNSELVIPGCHWRCARLCRCHRGSVTFWVLRLCSISFQHRYTLPWIHIIHWKRITLLITSMYFTSAILIFKKIIKKYFFVNQKDIKDLSQLLRSSLTDFGSALAPYGFEQVQV